MEQLSSVAFGISLFGGIYDLLTRRIPNWLTFSAVLLGLAAQCWFFGWPGFLQSVLGILLGFGLFSPVYFLGYMGAGDVKLLMAVGAWIGWSLCLRVAIASVIFGGVFAFAEILLRGRIVTVVKNTHSFLRSLLVPVLVPEALNLDKNRKFAFGICVALGMAAVIFLEQKGKLP